MCGSVIHTFQIWVVSISGPQPKGEPDMAADFNVVLNAKVLEEWKIRYAELEQQIKAAETEKQMLQQKIWAVQNLFLPQQSNPPQITNAEGTPIRDMTPTDAIMHFLKQAHGAIPQKVLREQIEKSGFDMERFGKRGGYFYTLLSRLVEDGRIIKTGDQIMSK